MQCGAVSAAFCDTFVAVLHSRCVSNLRRRFSSWLPVRGLGQVVVVTVKTLVPDCPSMKEIWGEVDEAPSMSCGATFRGHQT